MEQIKELTKRLIANSFKELMLQIPFEKITIKMITDHASVIRPTFYNHFHDKYELVEWIVNDEIIDPAREMFELGNIPDGLKHLIEGFCNDREYYRRTFDIVGQNGFGETLIDCLSRMFEEILGMYPVPPGEPDCVPLLARYYAGGLMMVIRYLVFDAPDMTAEEIMNQYHYMIEHSIYQLIKKDN